MIAALRLTLGTLFVVALAPAHGSTPALVDPRQAPRVSVTVKQAQPPRLGDFFQFRHHYTDPEDGEEWSSIETKEVDRIENDKARQVTRYRSRSFWRNQIDKGDGLLGALSSLMEGEWDTIWSYIDPRRKAWVLEYQFDEWDDETLEPTGKVTTITELGLPSPVTGQGQIIRDGDNVLKVVSLSRVVTVPAGSFRCVVTELLSPPLPGDEESESYRIVNYHHLRLGCIKSEYFEKRKGKHILTNTMELQWAELHDENGIKSHRDYALKKKARPKPGAKNSNSK